VSARIRPATQDDLKPCLRLSGACASDRIWQIGQREGEDQIAITFTDVRLPRPMPVEYPRTPEDIMGVWDASDALLVAEQEGIIGGFVDMRIERGHHLAWVRNLIVAEQYRRRGLGSALLRAADRWAHAQKIPTLLVEAQSQNGPAIAFYRALGFTFCGFNERYFANQVALFFARRVK
jgi:ribosomal protein S18 acetylase RimI-like enzyme